MTREMKSYGFMVLVPIVGAFAEMFPDVDALVGVIASAFAADHIQFFSISAMDAKGMHKQRIRTAWGHAAHQGWALLLLGRCRNLIAHGPRATHSAGGKFDDERGAAAARRPPLSLPWTVPRSRLIPRAPSGGGKKYCITSKIGPTVPRFAFEAPLLGARRRRGSAHGSCLSVRGAPSVLMRLSLESGGCLWRKAGSFRGLFQSGIIPQIHRAP